jgi:hypothetical protein
MRESKGLGPLPEITSLVFVGTRDAMTPEQHAQTVAYLNGLRPSRCAWRMAPGSTDEFAQIIVAMRLGIDVSAYCAKGDPIGQFTSILTKEDPHCVLAVPKHSQEERDNWPWPGVKIARERKIPVYIIWPDGTVQHWTGRPR